MKKILLLCAGIGVLAFFSGCAIDGYGYGYGYQPYYHWSPPVYYCPPPVYYPRYW